MRFNPFTEEDFKTNEFNLKEGDISFVIKDFEIKTSQAGNEMLVLTLGCTQGAEKGDIKDSLVFIEKAKWKISVLSKSIGDKEFSESLKKGFLDPKILVGKTGKALLKFEEYKKIENGSEVTKKSLKVKKYYEKLTNGSDVVAQGNDKEDQKFDDDIPF